MIEQEFLFLGLIKESPKHGYEIKKKIKEILSTFAGIELKSIYYPLKKLEANGYLLRNIGKSGRRPQHFTYSLTSEGEARFKELLNKSFLELKRPLFNLELSLYFLPYIDRLEAKRRLRARIVFLNRLKSGLKGLLKSIKAKETSSYLLAILEHNIAMVEAEMKFLARLTSNL